MKTAEKKNEKILPESELNNIKNNNEEIIAQHYDHNKDSINKSKSKSLIKNQKDDGNSTYSNIEFNKHELFFYSLPNIMAYDSVTIKNTGKTCVYYKWQKNNKPFILEEKKSDGIDRFYCHYADSKIFPDEERKFTFSFFSEKNGVFSEEWFLATTPPLKNCDLHLHLSGLVHKYVDQYSDKVQELELKIEKSANKTNINEFVLDLVDSIREQIPPKPNMNNEKIFKFYFQYYNNEYNVEFSKRVMMNLQKLNNSVMNELLGIVEEEKPPKKEEILIKEETKEDIDNLNMIEMSPHKEPKKKGTKKALLGKKSEKIVHDEEKQKEKEKEKEKEGGTTPQITVSNTGNKEEENILKKEPEKVEEEYFIPKNEIEEKKYWNSSIDVLKERISQIQDEEHKKEYNDKLNCILHISHKKGVEDSCIYDFIKNIILDELENINETSNKIREELILPPYTFDLLTRKSLNEADLTKYDAELKKKKDDFLKKNKKKPPAKGEEEKDEMEEYREKLMHKLSENILIKMNKINSENNKNKINDDILKANILDESYIERLSRIKTFNNVKTEGGFDNKYVVLRVDLEECKLIYVDDVDEEGNVIGNHLSTIDYLTSKDKILQSLSYLLNNGVKAVLLLVDFGPKAGNYKKEYSLHYLTTYIEKNLEHPTYFCNNLEELIDYNKKLEEEDLKDNCCIIMENLNFFPEECGVENYQEDLINPNGEEKSLCLYNKRKFLNALTNKSTIFVNDSIFSFDKYYPTIIDVDSKLKVLGTKIQEQLKKIIEFFSIENNNYVLILGDNDIFRVKGRKQIINPLNINNNEKENDKEKDKENEGENKEEKIEKKFESPNTENILDEGYIGGSEILDYSDEESLITNLLILNAIMGKFKKIFIMGKLALQFIQFLRHDYELFDNNLYQVNENLFKIMRFILIKADLLGIDIILPDDFKILNKEEFKKHLEPFIDPNGMSKNYTKEIKTLLKRERIQMRLEKAYTDPEELAENADYQRVKLEDEQIEHLKYYKEKTIKINRMPYCYDFVREFTKEQKIEKPKKVFKTPLERYKYIESIYNKELVYPEEVLQASEYNMQKNKKIKEKEEQRLKELEEEKEKEAEEENEKKEKEAKESKEAKEPKEAKESKEQKDQKDNKKKEEQNVNENNVNNKEEENNENEEENKDIQKLEEKEEEKEYKIYDPRLYDYDNMELVDFGEETYDRLIKELSNTYGVMWIGRLSPSKAENIFDNYPKIIQTIQERKKNLKEKFEEEQATQEKSLKETDMKAKKQLLNVFLKSNSAYEEFKETFRMIVNGQANPDEYIEEEEGGQDEEQFNHDLHTLIDYYIDDDFELINSILKGKHICGFYGLDKDEPIEKVEEFDPKCLENITN